MPANSKEFFFFFFFLVRANVENLLAQRAGRKKVVGGWRRAAFLKRAGDSVASDRLGQLADKAIPTQV